MSATPTRLFPWHATFYLYACVLKIYFSPQLLHRYSVVYKDQMVASAIAAAAAATAAAAAAEKKQPGSVPGTSGVGADSTNSTAAIAAAAAAFDDDDEDEEEEDPTVVELERRIRELGGTGIVYCRTKAVCNTVYNDLLDRGVNAELYHGVSNCLRQAIHTRRGARKRHFVLCCLNAGPNFNSTSKMHDPLQRPLQYRC